MKPARPSAPFVVIGLYALIVGAGSFISLLDFVILLRGGTPLLTDTPPEAAEGAGGVGLVLLGLSLGLTAAYTAAGIGLLRSKAWARGLMRAVALLWLAVSVGSLAFAAYWRWSGLAAPPPPLEIESVALSLLIVAVLSQGTGTAQRPRGASTSGPTLNAAR